MNPLAELRNLMRRKYPWIGAYVISSSDAHNSEYLSSRDKRREFISGFTGSAGTAVISDTKAVLLTDERYTIQAHDELDSNWSVIDKDYYLKDSIEKLSKILALPKQSKVAIDSQFISHYLFDSLKNSFDATGLVLVSIENSIVDEIWTNKPEPNNDPIFALDDQFCGCSSTDKIIQIRSILQSKLINYHLISELDMIAWCLNLRGNDITFNPVFCSYLVLSETDCVLFVNENQLTETAKQQLLQLNCQIRNYGVENVLEYFENLKIVISEEMRVSVSQNCNEFLVSKLQKNFRNFHLIFEESPISNLKAVKTVKELSNLRKCHIRDSIALCLFFDWLENTFDLETVTEISAADKLAEFRSKMENFKGLSFETISSVGKNAAIVHYKPKTSTNKQVTNDQVYLVDSGGHYLDGTTDVTRTMHLGTPEKDLIDHFTLVLKGFIQLHTTKFPDETLGQALDSFARKPLWDSGLSYGHGTGHGVGTFLCVHEKPILGRSYPNQPPIKQGTVVTIEPGFYRENRYGIRIENVTEVVESFYNDSNIKYVTFRSLTYVPIQRSLINKNLMSQFEIDFLNKYHEKCRDNLIEFLDENPNVSTSNTGIRKWILKNTQPI